MPAKSLLLSVLAGERVEVLGVEVEAEEAPEVVQGEAAGLQGGVAQAVKRAEGVRTR